jgi:hypothetical protein
VYNALGRIASRPNTLDDMDRIRFMATTELPAIIARNPHFQKFQKNLNFIKNWEILARPPSQSRKSSDLK